MRILQQTPKGSRSRVIATDASELTAAGHLADAFEAVARVDDSRFIPEMRQIASAYGVDQIVPTIDTELAEYARNREGFLSLGTDVLISSPSVVSLASDKWEFYRWLSAGGFPTVETFERIDFDPSAPIGPVIAKPRAGSSSQGVLSADSSHQLPLSHLAEDYIIQERANGVELTVDFAVSASGHFLGCVPRRRLEVRAGEIAKGVTVRSREIEDLVRAVATALEGAYGVLNLQVFYEPSSHELNIIELNARVGGGFPLTHAAGANFFERIAVRRDRPISQWRDNMVMLRYDDAVFVESTEVGTL